jgi:hypothetical protein
MTTTWPVAATTAVAAVATVTDRSMRKRPACIALFAVAWLACDGTAPGTDGPYAFLSALPEPYLWVLDDNFSALEDGEFQVHLGFGERGPTIDPICARLKSELRGTANGVPLTVTSRGGRSGDGLSCNSIELHGRLDTLQDPVAIRIWDHTLTIEVDFPVLFGPRTLTLLQPADGPIYVGDEVRLRWSPATDRITKKNAGVDLTTVVVSGGTGGRFFYADAGIEGDRIAFQVPEWAFPPPSGPGYLTLSDHDILARPSRCLGVKHCGGVVDGRREPRLEVEWVTQRRP